MFEKRKPAICTETTEYSAEFGTEINQILDSGSDFREFKIF